MNKLKYIQLNFRWLFVATIFTSGCISLWALNTDYVNFGSSNQTTAWGSAAFGTINTNWYSQDGLAVGYNNAIYNENTVVVGTGNRAAYPDCTVVGKYATDISYNDKPLFVVGNGTGSSSRNHAFLVQEDGSISKSPVTGTLPSYFTS